MTDNKFGNVKLKKRGAPKKVFTKKGYYYRLSLKEYQSVTYLLDTMRQAEKSKEIFEIKEDDCISNNYAVCYSYNQFYAILDSSFNESDKDTLKPIIALGVIKETNNAYHLTNMSAYHPDFKVEAQRYNQSNKRCIIIDKKNFKCSSQMQYYHPVCYPNYKRALAALLISNKSNIIRSIITNADTNLINKFLDMCAKGLMCRALEYAARTLKMDYLFNTEGLFLNQEFDIEENYLKTHGFDEYRAMVKKSENNLIMY